MFYMDTFRQLKKLISGTKYTSAVDCLTTNNDEKTFDKYMKYSYHYNIYKAYPAVLD